MSLMDVLAKMKLVETVEVPASEEERSSDADSKGHTGTAGKAPTALHQMVAGLPPVQIDEKAVVATPADGGPDFASVYKAAGVTDPVHGFTAYKILELLSSEAFQSLDSKAKAGAVGAFLKMNPSGAVSLHDVIQDAVTRDRALDGFEEFLRKKLGTRTAEVESENNRLQTELDALARKNRELMEKNRKTLEVEQRRFAEWQLRKQAEERKLFEAVAPFVEENPVTLSGAAGAAPQPPAPEPRK